MRSSFLFRKDKVLTALFLGALNPQGFVLVIYVSYILGNREETLLVEYAT